MARTSGSLSIRHADYYYTLHFADYGWMAAEMVQYIGDLYLVEDTRVGILKLLGYTLEISGDPPPRTAVHWVELDLEKRILSTNSDFVRKAVKKEEPDEGDPYLAPSLHRLYAALDSLDYAVELYS